MNNKKAIIIFLMIIAFMYWLGSSPITPTNKNPQSTLQNENINYDETFVNNIVKNLSKQLPRQMNKDMQATTVGAVGMKLIFKYNLINAAEKNINKKQIHEEYYKNTMNAACTAPDISKALLNGMSMEYQIYDKNNRYLTQFTITSSDCKK